jgi:hypothetical protein
MSVYVKLSVSEVKLPLGIYKVKVLNSQKDIYCFIFF